MTSTTMREIIRAAWTAVFAMVAASAAIPARASTFSVTNSTTGSTTTFTVTRSDTNAAETVCYRTESRTAFAGQHFMGGVGNLNFAAGDRTKSVQITERSAAQISNPVFLYYQNGGTTGSSRTCRFEIVDNAGFPLASADRTISYDSFKSVSSSACTPSTPPRASASPTSALRPRPACSSSGASRLATSNLAILTAPPKA